ncbi:MAG TPA: DMT family transporter [Thiobacillaceae bacterium]|nr:DMT family transporter [Thiobacillaceae bacterium]
MSTSQSPTPISSSHSSPTPSAAAAAAPWLARGALLTAAFSWGVIWYPYRLLEQAGLSGSLASWLTYLLAALLVLPFYFRQLRPPAGKWRMLLLMALVSGGTNLAYVLAVISGEVMRVMLLFYLAPLWTVLFARLILGERPGGLGYLVVALSLAGATVMLGGAEGGPPLPAGFAEWLGLLAGIGFALANVLTRRIGDIPLGTRSLWVFLGVMAASWWPALGGGGALPVLGTLSGMDWLLLWLTGLGLVVATLSVQYGLAHAPANQAVIILLTELIWAAASSWWLAGESMGPREWLGGAMIVAATLLTGKMEAKSG